LQNKIFATVLFLTSAVSCSSFRPTVLLEAYLDPKTTTTAGYEDINWSYALFNQYASGLTYELDFDNEDKPGDMQFGDERLKIVCDMKSFLYLCGTELDFSDGLNGKGFNFINPNASRTCGCGESFSI